MRIRIREKEADEGREREEEEEKGKRAGRGGKVSCRKDMNKNYTFTVSEKYLSGFDKILLR